MSHVPKATEHDVTEPRQELRYVWFRFCSFYSIIREIYASRKRRKRLDYITSYRLLVRKNLSHREVHVVVVVQSAEEEMKWAL